MRLETIVTGGLACNNYLLVNEQRREGVLIDCGDDAPQLLECIENAGIRLTAVLLTHGHADHIAALDQVAAVHSCPVYIHGDDQPLLVRALYNLSPQALGRIVTVQTRPQFLKDRDRIEAAGFIFEVIHTPGHTRGSVCYRADDLLFTGDTLFEGSIGGDLPPFGDLKAEIRSIKERLFTLEQDCVCHTGHGNKTTLSYEKQNNLYCKD